MRRRDLFLGLSVLGIAGRGTAFGRPNCSFPERRNPAPLYRRIAATPNDTYATYPHANGFLSDGRIVIAQRGDKSVRYSAVSLDKPDAMHPLAEIAGARMYYAVSHGGLMVAPTLFGARVVDLAKSGKSVLSWDDPEYTKNRSELSGSLRYNQDVDIAMDGSRVLLSRTLYEDKKIVSSSVVQLDIGSGRTLTIAEDIQDPSTGEVVPLDHAHFSPFDPNWICFCDARNRAVRRMWTWHPQHANPARPLVDQSSTTKPLLFTHERALFDRPSLLSIVYGSSPGAPRGLYEVPLSGKPPRLVSESNLDLHCNAGPHSDWYVVSLQGTADRDQQAHLLDLCMRPGGQRDPDWLKSEKGYSFSDVVLVNSKTGARSFLFQGANANNAQPYEVQPAISPDGRWVIIKDARQHNVLGLEVDQNMLREFLAG